MRNLELLAPARNADIGIAAIDCGADAVYIAGPAFGARKAAGNSVEDIHRLCEYAHKFGARVFITVNTIIFDDELDSVHKLMLELQDAGADAFIVQDLALTSWDDITIPLHASTQCAIRDADTARFYASLGFSRLVLERQLSLQTINEIAEETGREIEFFVHGALCVCYSGNCYLSEHIEGRSANRGECIQACRSLYDLVDGNGKVLVKNKALLSLKDYNLSERLEDLIEAGVISFKIEGRLKNEEYVKNTVRAYSEALDNIVGKNPGKYSRASFGKVRGGFSPDLGKTFNRSFTSLFLDGEKNQWSSMNAPKFIGEFIGIVSDVKASGNKMVVTVKTAADDTEFRNGDGFSFSSGSAIIGFRGDVCSKDRIECKAVRGLAKGVRLYRNSSIVFGKGLNSNPCERMLETAVDFSIGESFAIRVKAVTEDGREASISIGDLSEQAKNGERMLSLIQNQISKRQGHYNFELTKLYVGTHDGSLPLISVANLNEIRRNLAELLDSQDVRSIPMDKGSVDISVKSPETVSYKYNVANRYSRNILISRGAKSVEDAFEISHKQGAELMRSKYCIRFELGLCPVHQCARDNGQLFLLNNGRRLALGFDCKNCEMTVKAASNGYRK